MWSYANADTGGAFQEPGPVLCVNEGDTVTVNLHNGLAEPTSIVFPGQEGVSAGRRRRRSSQPRPRPAAT